MNNFRHVRNLISLCVKDVGVIAKELAMQYIIMRKDEIILESFLNSLGKIKNSKMH